MCVLQHNFKINGIFSFSIRHTSAKKKKPLGPKGKTVKYVRHIFRRRRKRRNREEDRLISSPEEEEEEPE